MHKVSVNKVSHPEYSWRVRYPEAGKRRQKFTRTKSEALKFADAKKAELAELGSKHSQITDAERRAVHAFRELMGDLPPHLEKVALHDVVNQYAENLQRSYEPLTMEDVTDRMLTTLKAENKSVRHVDSLRYRMKPFLDEYGDWMASNITTEIINDFLIHAPVGAQSKIHYRRALHQVMECAISLKATSDNPVKAAMKPKVDKAEPRVLNPQQVASLLTSAEGGIQAGLAIHFFAGLRRSEVERLDWSEVKLDEGLIEVKGKKAKGARRRLVPISDNLRQWLLPLAEVKGSIAGSGYEFRKGSEEARGLAEITDYPHNAGRHSYASYHVALHDDAGKLAANLGHTDAALLYTYYRTLVTPKDAETYWSITPQQLDNVTDIKAV